jgi:hypothetical protein
MCMHAHVFGVRARVPHVCVIELLMWVAATVRLLGVESLGGPVGTLDVQKLWPASAVGGWARHIQTAFRY